ncbi:unnamed protein product [Ixodes hexagonus]
MATLQLQPVKDVDDGEYRCRVDYKRSRTQNRIVRLNVVVPPTEVVITNRTGEPLRNRPIIGPFNEGSSLTLVCKALGGKPCLLAPQRMIAQFLPRAACSGGSGPRVPRRASGSARDLVVGRRTGGRLVLTGGRRGGAQRPDHRQAPAVRPDGQVPLPGVQQQRHRARLHVRLA